MLTGVMVDVVGTTAQEEQEEQSLRMLKKDIADVAIWLRRGCQHSGAVRIRVCHVLPSVTLDCSINSYSPAGTLQDITVIECLRLCVECIRMPFKS